MRKKQYVFWCLLCLLGTSLFFTRSFFSSKNHCEIPLRSLHCFDVIYLPVEIEGRKYCLELDLGMGFSGSLKKNVLEKLKKEADGTVKWKDAKGQWYVAPKYVIPNFRMGRARFSNVSFHERNEEFCKNVMTAPDPEKRLEYERNIDGLLGLGLFLEAKIPGLFLDLGNKKAFLIKDIQKFHEAGYCIQNMEKIPFEKKYSVLVLEAETDIGKTRFMLDTGSSQNILKEALFPEKQMDADRWRVNSSTFVLGGKNFGREKFDLEEMDATLEDLDGVLGMPFFKKYAVLFDFEHQFVYVGRSSF